VEIPELSDLIWLFEDEPSAEFPGLGWPNGLQSFRLGRLGRYTAVSASSGVDRSTSPIAIRSGT
jgi:hypothetical protein